MRHPILLFLFATFAILHHIQAQNNCENLISNGDFQSGNVSFSSGLPLACNSCTAGTFCVTNNFTGKCPGWPSVFDHTFGNASGLFLAIDGSTSGANPVWSVTGIPVVPGVTYEFSFYISTVFSPAQQQFDIGQIINNVNISTVTISQAVGAWIRYSSTWVCPAGITSIPLEIRQLTAGAFRDFGIDDVSFRCISCEADFTFNHIDNCGLVTFSDQSYGQLPVFYIWNFDDPGSGSNNLSNLSNPTHQFSTCGEYDVCVTITTSNGCVSEKCQSVEVTDTLPPVALCLGVGLELQSDCQAIVSPGLIDGGSVDNCSIASMSVFPSVVNGCGEFPVTLTVTDWCGNSNTCQTTVQTLELIPPVITCPSDIALSCYDIDPVNTGIATATDSCTSFPLMAYSDQVQGSVPCDALIIRTWTATDSCGNVASCMQQITVNDNLPPVITGCPSDISITGSVVNGICEALVVAGSPSASDHCDNNVAIINDFNGQLDASGVYQMGSTLVTWTATDDCGNTATCSFSVTVECLPCDSVSVLTGITGYYPFYSNADDLSSFANHGTVNGATLTAGHDLVNNSAYLFNGSSNSIVAGSNNRGITNKVTLAAWVKTTETSNGQWVAGKYSFSDDKGYLLSIGDNASNSIGQVAFSGRDGSGIYHSSGFSPARINDGEWHCVVGTAGNGFWKIYVDGILQNSTAASSNNLATSGEPFTIGWHTNPPFPFWMNGAIDDVLIYNRDLTADDVRCLCQGIVPPVSSCCEDLDTFCENVENAVDILIDNDSCKLTFQIGDLPECDYIEWINWGDNMQSSGNFVAGDMPMHTYTGPGPYIISYLAIELNDSGFICFEKIIQDTIQLDCQCGCGGFTDMFVRTPQGAMNMSVLCGGPQLNIPCPDPGRGFHLTGVFNCNGTTCPPDHQITWSMVHQGSGITYSQSFVDNDPYFGIYILPAYISQPGLYTLTLSGVCAGDTCVCEVQFIIDCPGLCDCGPADIQEFSDRVDMGFAVSLANSSCKACFSPLGVNDCETVDWYINSAVGTPIGSSIGSQTFCDTFPSSGTFTIYMVVTRLKPDGSICEVFVNTKTINVNCNIWADCDVSILTNPRFNLQPVAGGLGNGGGGASPGWIAVEDNPVLIEGIEDSHDAWSMLLTGCYFNSDVLGIQTHLCLSNRDTGTISIRLRTPGDPIPGVDVKLGRKPPGGGRLTIAFSDQSWQTGQRCDGKEKNCFTLNVDDLFPIEDDDWYDVYIPYNLKTWEPLDSCSAQTGEAPAYFGIWLSNMISSDQGKGPFRDALILDNICMNGMRVNTSTLNQDNGYRIFPNPAFGDFQLELSFPAGPDMTMKLTDLSGRVLRVLTIAQGSQSLIIETGNILPGMYFAEILQKGQKMAVLKVVRQ